MSGVLRRVTLPDTKRLPAAQTLQHFGQAHGVSQQAL